MNMSNKIHKLIVNLPDLKYEGTITKEEVQMLCLLVDPGGFWTYQKIKIGIKKNKNTLVIANDYWQEPVKQILKNKVDKTVEDIING